MTINHHLNFKAGQQYRADLGDIQNFKIHIITVIDEGLTYCPMVVYRYYGRHKQWWHYRIESAVMLTAAIERAKN